MAITATGNVETRIPGSDRLEARESSIVVRPMTRSDASAWDEFVFSTAGGTFFHLSGWHRIFGEVFRLTPCYLVAERGGHIAGILPLVHQRSLLFGNALISLPFCVEGGPLAQDEETRSALDAAAVRLMADTGADYLEFRSRQASRRNWQNKCDLYANFSRPICADDNKNLLAIPRKQRAVVRKTLAGGLVSETDIAVDRLFRVYSESVRNLGTPMFPKKYFSALKQTFGNDCDIVVVLDDGKPVSAVMNFYFKDTVMPYYGG